MTLRDDAVADLAEAVGRALITFAEQLRVEPTRPAVREGEATLERKLGASQELVLEKLKDAGADGLTSTQVADEAGLKKTNTPRILKALQDRGLVTGSDEVPAVWRAVEDADSDE